jgi:hypothetical protein
MNEVSDICHRILERPAPPMRDGAQVLTVARDAARRQVRITVTAGGLIAAAVVAVMAAVGTLHAAAGAPRPAVLLTAVAIPSLTQTPPREKAGPDAGRLARLLADALPAGYGSRPAFGTGGTDAGSSSDLPGSTSARSAARASLVVSTERGHGTLSATVVRDDAAMGSGDPCSPATAVRLDAYLDHGDTGCHVIAVHGVRIRVGATAGGSTATRFLADGFVTIEWNPATSRAGGQDPPPASLFTMEQLAAVAASLRISG